jgi:hypothetical protein
MFWAGIRRPVGADEGTPHRVAGQGMELSVGSPGDGLYGAIGMAKKIQEPSEFADRSRQVALAVAVLCGVLMLVAGLLIVSRSVPGFVGEYLVLIAGLLTTPFLLEAAFIILGLVIVVALNLWRQKRDGDEFVYIEQVEGPGVPAGLPDHAKFVVHHDKQTRCEEPALLVRAEGALALADYEQAAALIAAMTPEELRQPAAMRLRSELARATGRHEQAERLEREIRELENRGGCVS